MAPDTDTPVDSDAAPTTSHATAHIVLEDGTTASPGAPATDTTTATTTTTPAAEDVQTPGLRSSTGWDGKLRLPKKEAVVSLANPEAISDPEYSDDENVLLGEVISADEDILNDEDPDTEDIVLTQSRVHSLGPLHLERFARLQRLCLRQNNIQSLIERHAAPLSVGSTIEDVAALDLEDTTSPEQDADGDKADRKKTCPLAVLASTLLELDLYDNLIGHMRGVEELPNLTTLDLSFNKIKTIKHMEGLAKLRDLYLVANKISSVEGLEGLAAAATLRMLELGSNRLRSVEPLGGYGFAALEELWVAKNKITSLEGVQGLPKLRLLSAQSNRLRDLSPVRAVPTLEELYVSHNALESLASLKAPVAEKEKVLANLRVLDIGNNAIRSLTGTEHLTSLEEVWAAYNRVVEFDDVQKCLGDKTSLETVYLEGNPLQLRAPALYRNKVRLALPQVKQIDATYV